MTFILYFLQTLASYFYPIQNTVILLEPYYEEPGLPVITPNIYSRGLSFWFTFILHLALIIYLAQTCGPLCPLGPVAPSLPSPPYGQKTAITGLKQQRRRQLRKRHST